MRVVIAGGHGQIALHLERQLAARGDEPIGIIRNPGHATDLLAEFARRAVAVGGTVSAEHGVGKRKAHLLKLQYAPEHLEAMRAVKRRLDPSGILGRGTSVA